MNPSDKIQVGLGHSGRCPRWFVGTVVHSNGFRRDTSESYESVKYKFDEAMALYPNAIGSIVGLRLKAQK